MGLESKNNYTIPVAVAVSGGADSLMALYLLAREKRACAALHARFVQDQNPALEKSLQEICSRLQVPLHVLDLRQEFEQLIIRPFVQTYLQGETPNPCAWCNTRIKFGLLLQKARELGAGCLASGHYVRQTAKGLLQRGLDSTKEQSYFLALLDSEQTAGACFPLGCWHKEQVRIRLRQEGLHVPVSEESQEICFVPDRDYRSFLFRQGVHLPGPGPIADTGGRVLGRHQGLYCYTIGQRKGLGIAYREPLYVLGKNMQDNMLVVGPAQELRSRGFMLREPNFVLPGEKWPQEIWVQTNYREQAVPAVVEKGSREWYVRFLQERKPATPGQVAAFYCAHGRILGGGIIHG